MYASSLGDSRPGSAQMEPMRSEAENYHEVALYMVRCALISSSSNRPLRWRSLNQELLHMGYDLSKDAIRHHMESAKRYLKDNFEMDLIQLEPVNLPGNQASTQRDEYILVSTLPSRKYLLSRVTPRAQQHERGLMFFVLTLIVLKSDGVSFSEILNGVISAQLHPLMDLDSETDMLEEVNRWLARIMKNLLAQRIFETIKKKAPATSANGDHEKEVTLYCMGPSARYLVSSRGLFEIILKIQFPNQDSSSDAFKEKNKIAIRSLKQKFENTILESIS